MSIRFLFLFSLLLLSPDVRAEIAASFANAGPVDSGTFRTAANPSGNDTITLAYTIDGAGAVSLDASTTNTNTTFVNLVNQFDRPAGTAGTTSNSGFFNSSFSLKIVPLREESEVPRLSITTLNGGGLGVEGQDSNRVDGRNLGGVEALNIELTAPPGMSLRFKSWTWVAGTGADMRFSNGTNLQDFVNVAASGSAAFDLVTSPLVLENGGTLTFGETPDSSSGAGLGGFTFEILGTPPAAADTVVSFANSGTGFGPTPPFIGAGGASATITLAFSIGSTGVIALDASTSSANSTFAAMVAEWDKANVGSVANPALFGQSFTLVGSQSGGATLTITELGGGGIGIQGENSNRVDGLNYGAGDTNSTPETLTWTFNAPAGLTLAVKGWSYVDGAGGDMRVSNGTTNSDFPNMTGATGTLALPNLPLANGQTLTFREIPGIGATTGAGIAGFTFAVSGPTAPPGSVVFDNGSGNSLWTTATNWNPDVLPVAPANALIDGFNVVVNSAVASGPAELTINNGSLTLTGNGALTMKSMVIGRNLEKMVRLVLNGSGISFGQAGSSASDEFAIGSAATIETKPGPGGAAPLQLGPAKLVLDLGAQWVLDGTNATGPFNVGDRFTLANFGSFSGSTGGIRTRNFDLPPNRRLDLVLTSTSLYYEVVAQNAATGPNIIIINTDDQAAGQHFNFEGRSSITPTMDTLASTGVRFTSAFAASTVCGPSRYALMTGRWASRNTSAQFIARYPLNTLGRFGVSDTELETDNQNLGAWLRQAGYRTGMVGKGHLTDDDLNNTSAWAAKGLLTYAQTANPATDAATNAKMKHNHRVLCQRMRAFGFDYVNSYYKANLLELCNDALNVHNQEWITKGALDFIEENHNERFFLYMAPTINHGPVRNDLTKTLRADVRFTGEGYLPNEDYSFMPARQAIIDQVTAAGKDLISARETWLDYSVLAILNKLTQHGIRNDTLIIFTSDHGEKTLYGPLIWGKSSLYDLGMKVPLVMNWPNGITSPGRVYGEIVSQVDIAPTLLELAGASALPTRPVDGVNLAPVLNGGSAAVREDLFCEIGYARAVRTKDRKYIALRYTPSVYTQIASGFLWPNHVTGLNTEPRPYYVNNSSLGSLVAATKPTYYDDDQLYNLITDPNENTNIHGQEPATTYTLKKRLAEYIGGIPSRPFRQFGDASREFSPAPVAAPVAPGSLQMQFLNPNSIQLTWSDAANSELGYVIRKKVNGGEPEIIAELPSGATTTTAALDPGVEDIVIEVASYNALGDTGVNQDLLDPESWRFRTFGDIDPTLSLPISQWNNDADGDGEKTIWEYAFGTNPRLGSSVARAELRKGSENGEIFLEYFVPRQRRRNVGIFGSISKTNLSSWQSGPPHCVVVEDGENHLLFRGTTPIGDEPRQFIRAGIIAPN
ncbi:MAG: sulfatase-like hydrolase/transferase [Verrucomicrobiales bacterium]